MATLLDQLMSSDNGLRKQAEREYERLQYQEPSALLTYLFASASASSAAALACVLLRGLAVRKKQIFTQLTADEFAAVRSQLLAAFVQHQQQGNQGDKSSYLRRLLANTLAAVAGVDGNGNGGWPELLSYIQSELSFPQSQLSPSPSPSVICCLLFLLDKLAEHIGQILLDNFELVVGGLILPHLVESAASSCEIRAAAALSLCSLLHEVKPEERDDEAKAQMIASSLSQAIAVLGATVSIHNNDLSRDVLSALDGLSQRKPYMFSRVWQPLLTALVAICQCTGTGMDTELKAMSLRFATSLLTNPASAAYCSTAESRTAFLEIAMNYASDVEDEDLELFFAKSDDEDGFCDLQNDDDDAVLCTAGTQCLDEMARCFEAAEIVHTCLAAAWRLVGNQDWRMRRAALLIAATICEGAGSAMYSILPSLVPQVLHLAQADPHPRVRFAALHCLNHFALEFPGEDGDGDDDDDDDDDDENSTPSFRDICIDTLPRQICVTLESNRAWPRVAALCLQLLRNFFDPNVLDEGEYEILTQVCDYTLNYYLLPPTQTPLFLLHELIPLLGTMAQLMPPEDLQARYSTVTSVLLGLVGDLFVVANNSIDEPLVRCLALEAFAFVGKAAGRPRFSADAKSLLEVFVRVLQQPSFDLQSPLASYILQSAALMAGSIEEEFLPYAAYLIPGLFSRVATEIEIEVSSGDEEGSSFTSTLEGGNKDSKSDSFSVYRRGIGNINVTCNSSQLAEIEISCKILYQLLLDVPGVMAPFIPDALRVLVPLIDNTLVFSDDVAETISFCISESLSVYLDHPSSSPPMTTLSVALVCFVLEALVQALTKQKNPQGGGAAPEQLSNGASRGRQRQRLRSVVGCLRECLQILAKRRAICAEMQVPHQLLATCLVLLRDEAIVWVKLKFTQQRDDDDAETEEELRMHLSDALGWVMQVCSDDDVALAAEFASQVQPLLDREPFASLFTPQLDEDDEDDDE